MTKDFITVILPKGLRFLDQAISTFFISFSLFSKLIVTISSTSVENTTPRTVNVTGFQSRLISGINLNFEFLRDPIHTALVLSTLMFRPDIEANCCKTHVHEQNGSLVPSRKKVVPSANCDDNISSSRMCIFSFFDVSLRLTVLHK